MKTKYQDACRAFRVLQTSDQWDYEVLETHEHIERRHGERIADGALYAWVHGAVQRDFECWTNRQRWFDFVFGRAALGLGAKQMPNRYIMVKSDERWILDRSFVNDIYEKFCNTRRKRINDDDFLSFLAREIYDTDWDEWVFGHLFESDWSIAYATDEEVKALIG